MDSVVGFVTQHDAGKTGEALDASAPPCEEVFISIGDKLILSFPQGECLKGNTWAIRGPKGDILSCRNDFLDYNDDKVEVPDQKCSQEPDYTIELRSVEPSSYEKLCLEIDETTCSCICLENASSVDKGNSTTAPIVTTVLVRGTIDSNVDVTTRDPRTIILVLLAILGVILILIFLKKKERNLQIPYHMSQRARG
ncbi:hypothetical protein NL108_010978 [Boleophthalmus pectinirostris]|nr:hypothetical protein NL108_010978 [Boleophthalmus pectinirostris]